MKKYLAIIIAFCSLAYSQTFSQTVNLESTVKIDTTASQISLQRIEINTTCINVKYDYKVSGRDVIGLSIPKIISDSNSTWGAMIVKIGDGGPNDQYAFDTWASKRFKHLSAMLEIGRMVNQTADPTDYAGARLSGPIFTIEFYGLTNHSLFGEKITRPDASYVWMAFHPQHAFIALGKQDQDYWAFFGTKNLKHFGNFTFSNYQTKSKNFWFRSQFGFGEINQNFFNQDLYLEGTSYMVIPVFYYKHFSPLCTKGDYSLKFEGRRSGKVHNYEIIMGEKIGNDLVRLAVGANSEYIEGGKNNPRVAPLFELYKSWKNKNFQQITELRYDMLNQVFSAYLIIRY